jgi:sugar phosphate isomerase/epimerase
MSVYVSTSCLTDGSDLFKVLDIYSEIGISNVELGCVHNYVPYHQLKRLKQYKFNFLCHNYFPPPEKPLVINLSTQNPHLMKLCKEQLKHSLDFCSEMGIELFTFHAGYRADLDINLNYPSPLDVIPYELAFITFAEALAEVNEYALQSGVRIAIENHVVSENNVINGQNPYSILYTAPEFERLWALIPSSNLGMLLDLGHLNATAYALKFDKYEFIDKVKVKVFAFHLHDNSGRSDEHKTVKTESWFSSIIPGKSFNKLPMILESIKLNPRQIVQQKRLLEEILINK